MKAPLNPPNGGTSNEFYKSYKTYYKSHKTYTESPPLGGIEGGYIRLGITGGMGSGKSVVSRLLRTLGIPVYDSDTETKRLMATDTDIRRDLTALVGTDVYAGGTLNKPLLASYLFATPEHALRVNAIVHPRVKSDFRQWADRHASYPLVGIESAILVSAGFTDVTDRILLVTAPEEVRIRRAMQRDLSSREEVLLRLSRQMSETDLRPYADLIVRNDGDAPLIPQVVRLVSQLVK